MSGGMPYCVFNLCSLEEHCCGQNRCCRNSYSIGHIGIACGIFAAILIVWLIYRYYVSGTNAIRRLIPNSTRNYDTSLMRKSSAFPDSDFPIESSK